MWFPPSYFQASFDSDSVPSGSPGTLVAPGNSNVEGSWVEIISDANVTFDVWELHVRVGGTSAAGVARRCLLDIGVDPAGGTSYTAIASHLLCGGYTYPMTVANFRGAVFRIPIFITSGSSIAARIQTSVATDTGAERVQMRIYGRPTRPELVPVGQFTETLGLGGAASSDGTDINFSGVAQTYTAWTSLGATAKDMWFWQLMTQNNETTMTNDPCLIQLGYGDGTTNTVIVHHMRFTQTNGEAIDPFTDIVSWAYHPVPAGSTMYVRVMRDQTATTGGGYSVLGVGG